MAGSKALRVALLATLVGAGAILTGCNPAPRDPSCGDGFVDEDFGEECDDGNLVPGDGCTPLTCVVEAGWQCTDETPLDGVPGTCVESRCGDMRVTAGEECDPGPMSTATCDADCTMPECGDGFLNRLAGEQCDDDNVMAGDGCTPECISEPATCGNGTCDMDGGETCANCMRDCNDDPSCNGCADADGDGYYDTACGGNDCNDADPNVHPDAEEILCNGIDDDCRATTSGTVDADGDGWRCGLDCDDANAAIAPELPEICGDDIDNDCDPATEDLGDADGDGVSCLEDCNDHNAMISPMHREVCNNGVNDDCRADTPDVADLDGDGFLCNSPSECDDYAANAYVGFPGGEILCDGVDNDCVPSTLDRPDADRDGVNACEGDCDDSNAAVLPGATEICGNGHDDDCDPATPELLDVDGDSFFCDTDCDDSDPDVVPETNGRCGPRFFYTENFDGDDGGWTRQVATVPAMRVSSWAWGVPSGAAKGFITRCAGTSAGCWVTALTTDYLPNELGYVVSPSFDMTTLRTDPTMWFSHIFETQAAADSTWIDISLDDGATWTRLGAVGEGTNWYNQAATGVANTWDGTSGAAGAWRTASHTLTGAAGHVVRVRFAFSSNAATQRDGVAFDDIVIDNQPIDLGVASVSADRTMCAPTGTVRVNVINNGLVVVPSYTVSLTIGAGAPIVRTVTSPVRPGETAVVTFTSVAYVTDPFTATATVTADGDSVAGNDTASQVKACLTEGDVRLIGGPDARRGRLEIYHAGVWGTVCDDGFTLDEADVVCRQLGYGDALAWHGGIGSGDGMTGGAGGPGVDPIWLDDVICIGTESNLSSCSHRPFGENNCSHSEDVGVDCAP